MPSLVLHQSNRFDFGDADCIKNLDTLGAGLIFVKTDLLGRTPSVSVQNQDVECEPGFSFQARKLGNNRVVLKAI